jgi:glycosyltransferase involved in cell wall biosynthesis
MKSFKAPAHITQNPRIYFAGPIASQDLKRYLAAMDVLVIPHYQDDTTDAQDPVKLYDYLSTGKPIVTTRIAGVEPFSDLVQIVDSPQQFFYSIEESIEENDPGRVELRRRAAVENSWKSRAKQAIGIIEESITGVNMHSVSKLG